MSGPAINPLDLAALLCSRVCHDLISPVGAIVNGLEVLAEEKDEETKNFALELIKKSSATASAKLQFCRIAFGAAGSAGAQIDLGDAQTIARGFLEDDKTKLAWNLPRALLAKNRVKLLLNMLLIAGPGHPARRQAHRRSRRHRREPWASRSAPPAPMPRFRRRSRRCLTGEGGIEALDAHRIQPFYTGLLANACGLSRRAWSMDGDTVVVATK